MRRLQYVKAKLKVGGLTSNLANFDAIEQVGVSLLIC